MISSLSGTVRHKDLSTLVVEVQGVGYQVAVPADVLISATPSSPVFLWTHLAVRENSLDLYGFLERETLEIFELLITISGIGPKTALGILNVASPTTLRQAVATGDTSHLTRISGIGKKNAEKIVLELKGKLHVTDEDRSTDAKAEGDALEALVSLGFSERDARDALKKISKDTKSPAERVKGALRLLAQ